MHRSRPFLAAALITLVYVSAVAGLARANPTLGFTENWSGVSLANWAGGAVRSNPGTGGVGGVGDGYLRFSTPNGNVHSLGVQSSAAAYTGNWIVPGVNHVRLWLNDVGADDPLEMHFSFGIAFSNVWQYNAAFLPPHNQWAEFFVDLSTSADWTQTFFGGTFTQALQAVDRVHIRHDRAPFEQNPDPIDADVGLDRLTLTSTPAGVPMGPPAVPLALRLAAPYPNPSRGPVAMSIEVFDDGAVSLEVVDAAGRRVRQAELAGAGPGTRIWTWNGLDDLSRPVPAGYYLVRAMGRAGGMSRGLVRID